jgi:hypothetical protein
VLAGRRVMFRHRYPRPRRRSVLSITVTRRVTVRVEVIDLAGHLKTRRIRVTP